MNLTLMQALDIIEKLIDAADEQHHPCLRDDMHDHKMMLAQKLVDTMKEQSDA